MNVNKLLLFVLWVFFLPWVAEANSSWCPESSLWFHPFEDANVIHVYVESDFAAEHKACVGNQPELTEEMIRYEIEAAIEVWNQQSIGPTLIFSGTYDGTCGGLPAKRPALEIVFRPTCKNAHIPPLTWYCSSDSAWATFTSSSCSGAAGKITIWGDLDTPPNPAGEMCSGSGIIPWKFGSQMGAYPTFRTTIAHELGHALKMGHSYDEGFESSIMGSHAGRRHLSTHDKYCNSVHGNMRGLTTYHRDRLWNSSLNAMYWTSTYAFYWGTIKSAFVGEAPRNSSGPAFHLRSYDHTDFQPISSPTSTLTFSSSHPVISELFDDVYTYNTFFTPVDQSAQQWSVYVDDSFLSKSSSPTHYDPPYLKVVRSQTRYETKLDGGSLLRCVNANCTSTSVIRSHLPLAASFDEKSYTSVYGWVNTAANNGSIYLHAGFHSMPQKLRVGSLLGTAVNVPTPYSSFNYQRKTDFPIGLGCLNNSLEYNCILAWVDRGIPLGRILYTYFKVNSSKQIEWHGTAYVRGYSRSASGVNLGNINDELFMVWKQARSFWTTSTGDIRLSAGHGSSYASWSVNDAIVVDGIVVDPPVVHFHNSYVHPQIGSLTWAGHN